jgi:hypothetical protein
VGIWACFSANGTGCCCIFNGRLDSERYVEILENYLIPSIDLLIEDKSDLLFQQDNAPCHKAKKVTEWFQKSEIEVLPWPARSPDLNPIENIWNMIDLELGKLKIVSLAQLETVLAEQWNKVSNGVCIEVVF